MVAITLTEKLIEGGKCLIEELDTSGIKVNGALWIFFQEEGFWKLMLSFPDVDKSGPKSAYSKVQKALSKLTKKDGLSLDDIAIAKSSSPLLHLLKKVVHTGTGISGIRFSNNVVNGQLIADAYIYRLI